MPLVARGVRASPCPATRSSPNGRKMPRASEATGAGSDVPQRFRRGDRLKKRYEFRQAQLNLLNAQLSYNQAKYNAKVAELGLMQISGNLLEAAY